MTTKQLLAITSLLKPENYVSIRELQKSPTKSLQTSWFKIIVNNWKPMWLFLSMKEFEKMQEEMQLLQDKQYLKDIEEAREEKEEYSREHVVKMFDLNV